MTDLEREKLLGSAHCVEAAEDFTVEPAPPGTPNFRDRDLIAYAKQKGVRPEDLTDEERAQFIIGYHD